MATYVNNLRLKEITTGDEDGTWGTSTNTNLELITDGFSYGTKEIAADANETFTMPDASADSTRSLYLKFTSAVDLTATREITLGPNTVSKTWIIENATTGGQIITIKQGSGATVNVANGSKVIIVTDGAGAGAAVFNANPTELDSVALSSVLATGNTTGGTDLAVSTGDDITFADSSKAIFGADDDLQIYHDGSHSYISDQGTGDLRILAADFRIRNAADDETMIQANSDADVSLWYNNSKKLATTNTGIDVTGNASFADNDKATFGAGNDLEIYHDGNNSYIKDTGTGDLRIYAQDFQIRNADGSNTMLYANAPTGGIQLFHTGVEKLATTTTGIDVTGGVSIDDDNNYSFGDGTTYIQGSGAADRLKFITNGSEAMRIDSSGNLLVGKTSADSGATAGIETNNNGRINATRDGSISGVFNRLTSDGEIVQFRKDGTNVGSIGAGGGNLNIGNGTANLRFTSGSISPSGNTAGGSSDGVTDLGISNRRFKDLYLSGTANVANVSETVYALSGTALDPANGGIQTKTLAANTTFTDSLASGESIVLQLEAGASYTVTWPTMTWVTSGGNTAPTLTAKDTLVFWKVSSTLYGAYTGSYV
ncbi:hypothetical protein N9350_01230 [Gammaproteobacteria bacterium]|nr:hypothetical protein [Gammaproteobacteria bacterium]